MSTYTNKAKTLALLPKFTGLFSVLGSFFIFQDVVLHKKSVQRVYHRLVLGLSCADMVASFINILSTWPIPADSEGVFLASGTTQTCIAQGFFNELGNLATPLYNASLCAYYVLVIRNGWAEDQIRQKAEPFMHFFPVAIAFTIAILGIPFTLYNNSGWLCWIAPYPSGCQGDECERGKHANIFRWVHYAIIWSAILTVTVGMYSIYRKVRQQERAQSRDSDDDVARRGRKSKKVAIQAGLFVGALYITWIFTTITRIYQITTGKNNFALLVLMATFFPLQGFFNCLIYLRPRYLRCKSRNPDASFRRLVYLCLHHDAHPIHGAQQAPATPSAPEADEGGRRQRSSNASYYSLGNKRASEGGNDDIQTVGAVASVSDYKKAGDGDEEAAPEEAQGGGEAQGGVALPAVDEAAPQDAAGGDIEMK